MQERIVLYDDGTDSTTKAKNAAMAIINKMTETTVGSAQSAHAGGRPFAFSNMSPRLTKRGMLRNMNAAMFGGLPPDMREDLFNHYKSVDPENFSILMSEYKASPPTVGYALRSLMNEMNAELGI